MIVPHVGAGAQVEDVLFAWPITGHYRHLHHCHLSPETRP